MLKLLVIGADAVEPKYIFGKPELYPTINEMIEKGASSAYSAYVQKGYEGSYLSEMNWSSIYTGLSPQEHQILRTNKDGKRKTPEMKTFQGMSPFWEVFNRNGLSVGLWSADCCVNPVEINGYVVSSKYAMIDGPQEERRAARELQVCEKEDRIIECLTGNVPPRLYPKTLRQQGYTYEELHKDVDRAWEAVEKYHFQDALSNFEEELAYFEVAMSRAQECEPVDVMYFYTPTTDLIAHCCMYCDDNDVLTKAYQLLDEFIGRLKHTLQPENTLFLSDHGMINFRELIQCSDKSVQREAFGARDEVLWLKNGSIAFEAYNGALLFTAHALKGTFVIEGKDIKHTKLNEMRTLDIYPTLLEALGIQINGERQGFVQDIFMRPLVNQDRFLDESQVTYKSIALVQCHQPSETDIILNELYIEKRFSKITIVGEEKYKEIFLNNPRVSGFISYEDYDGTKYDEVYCGMYNQTTKEMGHLRIK